MIFSKINSLESKIEELKKRIEILEYKKPNTIQDFVNKNRYKLFKDLYWLDRKYFIEKLLKDGYFVCEGMYGVAIRMLPKGHRRVIGIDFDVENLRYLGEIYDWICIQEKIYYKEEERIKKEKKGKKDD